MRLVSIVVLLFLFLFPAQLAHAEEPRFQAELSGAEEVDPVETEGRGKAEFEFVGASVRFELEWEDLSSSALAAHIHCGEIGENGPVGVTLFAGPMGSNEKVTGSFSGPDQGNGCDWEDLSDVLSAMDSGGAYVNVHTGNHPGGEIRGQVVERN